MQTLPRIGFTKHLEGEIESILITLSLYSPITVQEVGGKDEIAKMA